MVSKSLIEIGPMQDVDREQFLDICRVTDNDPVTVAALTDTNVGVNQSEAGSISRQGRTRRARGQFREHVKAVLGIYDIPPEAAKKYVQAARMQVLSDALRVNDTKTALEATKQIGSDQEIFGAIQIELKTDAIDSILDATTAEVISAVYLPDENDVNNEEEENDRTTQTSDDVVTIVSDTNADD